MTGWQTSRSTNRRHEHTVATVIGGRDICHCGQVIIKPITSFDDPRLENAGNARIPLPELLIYLYNDDRSFEAAPYIINVIEEHERRGTLSEFMWMDLLNRVS